MTAGRLLAACAGLLLCAGTPEGHAQAPTAGQRSPGALSVEERQDMMRHARDYEACLYARAMDPREREAEADIRRIADRAMGHCEARLQALEARIAGWGMPSHFAARFTRTVRGRAVRKLLPELAIRRSE